MFTVVHTLSAVDNYKISVGCDNPNELCVVHSARLVVLASSGETKTE